MRASVRACVRACTHAKRRPPSPLASPRLVQHASFRLASPTPPFAAAAVLPEPPTALPSRQAPPPPPNSRRRFAQPSSLRQRQHRHCHHQSAVPSSPRLPRNSVLPPRRRPPRHRRHCTLCSSVDSETKGISNTLPCRYCWTWRPLRNSFRDCSLSSPPNRLKAGLACTRSTETLDPCCQGTRASAAT